MLKLSVKANIASVTRGLSELQRSVVPRATQQALNRVAPTVKTHTVRALQKALRLRNQSGLRLSIKVVKASQGNLAAEVNTADRSIKMDETRNAVVKVTTKRIDGRRTRVTKVVFKGHTVDGLIQIKFDARATIRKKEPGRYSSGKRSQRVAPVYSYTQVQELISAAIDKQQETLGSQRFSIEFDRALANALRQAGF